MKLWNKSNTQADDLKTQVAIEYHAPHFVIHVKSPGHPEFKALRHPTTRVNVYDDYGKKVSEFAPIEAFANHAAAEARLKEVLPDAVLVKRDLRKPGYLKGLLA